MRLGELRVSSDMEKRMPSRKWRAKAEKYRRCSEMGVGEWAGLIEDSFDKLARSSDLGTALLRLSVAAKVRKVH